MLLKSLGYAPPPRSFQSPHFPRSQSPPPPRPLPSTAAALPRRPRQRRVARRAARPADRVALRGRLRRRPQGRRRTGRAEGSSGSGSVGVQGPVEEELEGFWQLSGSESSDLKGNQWRPMAVNGLGGSGEKQLGEKTYWHCRRQRLLNLPKKYAGVTGNYTGITGNYAGVTGNYAGVTTRHLKQLFAKH